jgi:hypothetical protein
MELLLCNKCASNRDMVKIPNLVVKILKDWGINICMHHLGQVSIAQPIQFEFVTIAKKEYASLASSICNKHTRSRQRRF